MSDPFLEASGATGSLLFSLEGPGMVRAEHIRFHQPFVVVGGHPRADLHLDHPGVSRRHAYLQLMGGRLYCKNLQTRSAKRPTEEPPASGWLARGGAIEVGPFRIRFLAGDDPSAGVVAGTNGDPPPTSRAFHQPDAVQATLEIPGLEGKRSPWRVSRALVFIGSYGGCKLRLVGNEISAYHGCIVRTAAGVWVVDLHSRSGTLVNGERVRVSRLEDGDELLVGGHRLRIHCEPQLLAPLMPSPRDIPQNELAVLPRAGEDRQRAEVAELISGTDVSLRTIMDEVSQIQKQMGDQFQQALLSMFHAFHGMHKEEMALIREELGHLRRLNNGERVLQAELDRQTQTADAQARTPVRREIESSGPAQPALPTTRPVLNSSPGSERGGRPSHADDRDVSLELIADPDIHVQIVDRIAALRSEQQGRWQKLINVITGGEPVPPTL